MAPAAVPPAAVRASAIRAAAVPLPVGLWGVTGSASVQRYDWFGSRPAVTVVRAGFRVPLPAALAFTLETEHNPLFVSAAAGGWNVAIKLEYATVVPLLGLRAAARGNVYEDRNGNGRRDSGESGLAGAGAPRRWSAVTDAAGRYRFLTPISRPGSTSSLAFAHRRTTRLDRRTSPSSRRRLLPYDSSRPATAVKRPPVRGARW
jgi:hypothetical protein